MEAGRSFGISEPLENMPYRADFQAVQRSAAASVKSMCAVVSPFFRWCLFPDRSSWQEY